MFRILLVYFLNLKYFYFEILLMLEDLRIVQSVFLFFFCKNSLRINCSHGVNNSFTFKCTYTHISSYMDTLTYMEKLILADSEIKNNKNKLENIAL